MLLVIDIGNTNTSLGVFDGEKLVAHWRLTTARSRTVDEWGVHTRNLFALAGLDFKSIDAIAIASDALFERAAKLPRVEIKRPQKVIGSDTVEAMQSGLYHGYAGLVDGILKKMIDELGGGLKIIATGGLAPLIAKGSELIQH